MYQRECNICGERNKIRFLFKKSGYSIMKCESCSLIYVNEIPSREELDNIYSKTFFTVGAKFDNQEKSAGRVNANRRVLEMLGLDNIGRDRWIDVGCATGDFIAEARPFVRELYGVEISDYAAGNAVAKGADRVFTGDFSELDINPKEFDVVTMWDFIEHVSDPFASMKKAFDLLKPGGYLLLSTGDVESRMSRLTGSCWHLMIPPKHLYFFSAATMSRLLAKAGFEPPEISYPGKRVPLDFILGKLAGLTVPSAQKFVLELATKLRLGAIAPDINFGDIMTATARKRASKE